MTKWRAERDDLVKALEQRMTALLETQRTNEAALAEKDEHIEHLKVTLKLVNVRAVKLPWLGSIWFGLV